MFSGKRSLILGNLFRGHFQNSIHRLKGREIRRGMFNLDRLLKISSSARNHKNWIIGNYGLGDAILHPIPIVEIMLRHTHNSTLYLEKQ